MWSFSGDPVSAESATQHAPAGLGFCVFSSTLLMKAFSITCTCGCNKNFNTAIYTQPSSKFKDNHTNYMEIKRIVPYFSPLIYSAATAAALRTSYVAVIVE